MINKWIVSKADQYLLHYIMHTHTHTHTHYSIWQYLPTYVYTYIIIMMYILYIHTYIHTVHAYIWYTRACSWNGFANCAWACRVPYHCHHFFFPFAAVFPLAFDSRPDPSCAACEAAMASASAALLAFKASSRMALRLAFSWVHTVWAWVWRGWGRRT